LPQASNPYARPPSFAWPYAPTMAVMPEMATDQPSPSPTTVSDPNSSAACFQPVEVLENTNARPRKLALPDAPTTAVVPEMATDQPKPP